ncbi:MAG: LysM peptidoglycan-binding domain-containing protein, partial [Actinomycetota bacterium]|nr:LysM peptidoglycan-binding domain-containing protein [Actinomycetota bacterium]
MRGRFTSRPGIALSALAIVAAAGSGAYTVRQGDTLSRIAQRHGVGVEQIAQANDIDDPDRIYVGQSLVIPSAESA